MIHIRSFEFEISLHFTTPRIWPQLELERTLTTVLFRSLTY